MDLQQFIQCYQLPAMVPAKRTAEIIPCAISTLYELHASHQLNMRKIKGRTFVPVDELFAFIKSRPVREA